jgi:hypothetical protein
MRQILILAFLLLNALPVFACLNGAILELKNGIFLYEDREGNVPHGHNFIEVVLRMELSN